MLCGNFFPLEVVKKFIKINTTKYLLGCLFSSLKMQSLIYGYYMIWNIENRKIIKTYVLKYHIKTQKKTFAFLSEFSENFLQKHLPNSCMNRVSIRKTFAQFLRNETQFFSFFAHQFCAKKTTICAIIRKSHFAQNRPIPLLRNSSFAQFRKFVKIKRLVTVCVS